MLAVMNDWGGGAGPRARIHYSTDRRAAGREWRCGEEACGRRESKGGI